MLLVSDGVRTRSAAESSERYKPHIDGLRAISIVAVLGYHAQISGFGGGFVGVDVFFVISGFLIINQIVEGLRSRAFSIWDFYARRALRILPPYFLMLAVTVIAGLLVVRSPRELESFAVSAALAPIFLTNVYFLVKSGYFDIGAHEKPLLHTWSLSVEEQFYLVAPLILAGVFLLARRGLGRDNRLLAIVAVLIAAASFAGCVAYTLPGKNPAFFLTHWRAWEFVAGGSVGAVATVRWGRFAWLVGTATGVFGLALIAISVTVFNEAMVFPGAAAAIPVAGAVLVLFSGIAAPFAPVGVVLSTAPLRFIGRISYALYLWHWPFLVCGRLLPFEFPEPVFVTVALGLSLLFSVATHYAIERPVATWRRNSGFARNPGLQKRVVAFAVGASLVFALGIGAVGGVAFWAAKQSPMLTAVDAAEVTGTGACLDPSDAAEAACLDGSRPLGLIVGDSHALAILPRIEWEAEQNGDRLLSLSIAGCNPVAFVRDPGFGSSSPICGPLFRKFEHFTAKIGAETEFAILAGIWNVVIENASPTDTGAEARFRSGLDELLSRLEAAGQRRLLLIGPVPELERKDPFSCIALSRGFGLPLDRCGVPRRTVELRRQRTVAIMKEIVMQYPNARFIDPIDLFCDDEVCLPLKDGGIAYMDSNHLNAFGAKLLFNRFHSDFLWAFKG